MKCNIFIRILSATILFGHLACDNKQVQQSAPNAVQTASPEPAKQPEPTMYETDPEYNLLIKYHDLVINKTKSDDYYGLGDAFVEEFSEEYKQFKSKIEERAARIEAKVDQYSDDTIKKTMREKFEREDPPVKPKDTSAYLNSAIIAYNKRAEACVERNVGKWFMVGTYENYIIEKELIIFSTTKTHLNVPQSTKGIISPNVSMWKMETVADGTATLYYFKYLNKSNNEKYTCADLPYPISERYREDSNGFKIIFNEDERKGLVQICRKTLMIKMPLNEIEDVYKQVNNLWQPKIDEIFQGELSHGGWKISSDTFQKYDTQETQDYLLRRIHSFVKRNAIALVAKGNPFKASFDELDIVVMGVDKSFKKLI